MSAPSAGGDGEVTRGHVARGALLAALSRAGGIVEVVAQPAYTWLFGIATYGVYTVLWATVNIVENVIDLSLTSALQRVVPRAESEEDAHGAVKFAIIVAVGPAILLAAAASLAAPWLAHFVSAAPRDQASLPRAIALFAWALPLWTFVEIATSAARARRAFGPEIRLRILWEQVARLVFAAGVWALGARSLGLLVAHLMSLAMTALLCVRLIARYYDLRLLIAAPMRRDVRRALLASGLSILPSAATRRLFLDFPPVLLNMMLPGAAGATAAGLFGIARKIASIPLIIRQAFQYVLPPLASAQAKSDRAAIGPLYRFATRVSTVLVVPLAGFLVLVAGDMLSAFAHAARDAVPLVVILVIGRALETIVGPASSFVEMLGHRALPLLNSAIGLVLWAALAVLLVPRYDATGMALAVSTGTVLSTWAAALELRLSDGLHAFDRKVLTGLAVALVGVAAMSAIGWAMLPLGDRLRAVALLAAFPLVCWGGLRLGLTRGDRAALGGFGRALRLA